MVTALPRGTVWRVALSAALLAILAIAFVRAAMPPGEQPALAEGSAHEWTAIPAQMGDAPPALTATLVSTPLTASQQMRLPGDRDVLGICVQTTASASLTEDAAREQVATAFEQVKQADYWPEMLDRERTLVDAGCPTVAAVLHPEHPLRPTSKGGEPDGEHRVEEPSPYFVHVIVLSDADLRTVFGSVDTRSQFQEMQCTEHRQCWQVTTGLYLTDSELADTAFVADWLSKAIGFVSLVPRTNVGSDTEESKPSPNATP